MSMEKTQVRSPARTGSGQPAYAARAPLVVLGFALVFFATLVLDQSTKIHAERNYLTWSHPSDARSYRSDTHQVFRVGNMPAPAGRGMSLAGEAGNWVVMNVTYVRNPGAAWGSFSSTPHMVRLAVFYVITGFVTLLILFLYRASHPGQRLTRTALVLILGGAVGNFVDRVLLQYVIDWIQFQWRLFGWRMSFPVFNLADVAITLGVVLLLADTLLLEFFGRYGPGPGPIPDAERSPRT